MIDSGTTIIAYDPRHVAHNPSLEDDAWFVDPLERRAVCGEGCRPMDEERTNEADPKFVIEECEDVSI